MDRQKMKKAAMEIFKKEVFGSRSRSVFWYTNLYGMLGPVFNNNVAFDTGINEMQQSRHSDKK